MHDLKFWHSRTIFYLVLAALDSLRLPAFCDPAWPDLLIPPDWSQEDDGNVPSYDISPIDLDTTRPDCFLSELFPPAGSLERLREAYPKAAKLARHLADLGPYLQDLPSLPWPSWSCDKPAGATGIFDLSLATGSLLLLPDWSEQVALMTFPPPVAEAALLLRAQEVTVMYKFKIDLQVFRSR